MYTGTYNRLNVSIHASNRSVIVAASRKMLAKHVRFSSEHRELRQSFYRELIAIHTNARALARQFRLG